MKSTLSNNKFFSIVDPLESLANERRQKREKQEMLRHHKKEEEVARLKHGIAERVRIFQLNDMFYKKQRSLYTLNCYNILEQKQKEEAYELLKNKVLKTQ